MWKVAWRNEEYLDAASIWQFWKKIVVFKGEAKQVEKHVLPMYETNSSISISVSTLASTKA
jgi:hypothetical protein